MEENLISNLLTRDSLNNNLESRTQFYSRVYSSLEVLNLDKEPFLATNEMMDQTWSIVANYNLGGVTRAMEIYSWMYNNMIYDKSITGYQTTTRTFNTRRGRCVDFGVLYTTMARIAGLESSFVDVEIDSKGSTEPHACSSIYIEGNKILVDVAHKGFNIKHVTSKKLSDVETINKFYPEYANAFVVKSIDSISIYQGLRQVNIRNITPISLYQDSKQTNIEPIDLPQDLIQINVNPNNKLKTLGVITLSLALITPALYAIKHVLPHNPKVEYRIQEPITEKKIKKEREQRFYDMKDELKLEDLNNKRLKNAKYPEDYLFVSNLYREYIEKGKQSVSKE